MEKNSGIEEERFETKCEIVAESAYFMGSDRPQLSNSEPVWMTSYHLPWVTLTLNDRHVLQQTHSSMCSRDPSVVSDYVLFLSEVVLQDFPVETFTQRPIIIQR
jgi:hypothetical protein